MVVAHGSEGGLPEFGEQELALVEVSELVDEYPLASYLVGCARMVTLKRSICVLK